MVVIPVAVAVVATQNSDTKTTVVAVVTLTAWILTLIRLGVLYNGAVQGIESQDLTMFCSFSTPVSF